MKNLTKRVKLGNRPIRLTPSHFDPMDRKEENQFLVEIAKLGFEFQDQ